MALRSEVKLLSAGITELASNERIVIADCDVRACDVRGASTHNSWLIRIYLRNSLRDISVDLSANFHEFIKLWRSDLTFIIQRAVDSTVKMMDIPLCACLYGWDSSVRLESESCGICYTTEHQIVLSRINVARRSVCLEDCIRCCSNKYRSWIISTVLTSTEEIVRGWLADVLQVLLQWHVAIVQLEKAWLIDDWLHIEVHLSLWGCLLLWRWW